MWGYEVFSMGPHELSIAMECPKRLLWSLEQDATEHKLSFDSELGYKKNDPIHQGLLFESLVQFLACGNKEMPNSGEEAWEERYEIISAICDNIMLGKEPFSENFAKTLGMSKRISQRLCGYWFEISSIDNILGWVADFFEDEHISELMGESWESEIKAVGDVITPLGECHLNGRIDLLCTTKSGQKFLFEIKARDKFNQTDERQLEMYHQMLGKDPETTLILLRGGDFIISTKYLENGLCKYEYEPEAIEHGTPKPIVCSQCKVPNCHRKQLLH